MPDKRLNPRLPLISARDVIGEFTNNHFQRWFALGWRNSGLPYHSPHKFRHGHAVYALKKAKDVPALKAVSQNLMHANISTKDGIYGILSETDVREQIGSLGKQIAGGNNDDLVTLIELVKQLEKRIQK